MHKTIIGPTTQVIVKHSHGHLFLLLDVIMGIPTQAKAIPMKLCDVKAILRYVRHTESDTSKSDATTQIDVLTSSILHTASYVQALLASIMAPTSTRRRDSEKAMSLLHAESIYVLKLCI